MPETAYQLALPLETHRNHSPNTLQNASASVGRIGEDTQVRCRPFHPEREHCAKGQVKCQ